MATVLAVSVGLLLLGHVVGFVQLLRNQRWLAWPAERRCRASGDRSVCVIVPARNEATDVAACLRSLLAQDYPKLKLIVVKDHSSDETPRIINEIAEGESRMIVIHDPPLRRGWLGKHNAMNAALQHVDSDLLLLTDADVEFHPACISFAVGELERANLSLLSLHPQFEFVTLCETILLPFYVGGAAILLSPAAEDPRYEHAMAVGAFILMRTDHLEKVGGFEPIKTAILDDIAMARMFKGAGFKIGLRSAYDLMRIRFFKGNRHAFFGFTKHMIGSVQDYLWLAPIIALIPLLIYGTLLFAAAYGIMHRQFLLASVAILTLVIHYVALLRTRPGNKFNGFVALAFPLMCVPFAASCLRAAYVLAAEGKFEWRGRETAMRTPSIATGEQLCEPEPPSGPN